MLPPSPTTDLSPALGKSCSSDPLSLPLTSLPSLIPAILQRAVSEATPSAIDKTPEPFFKSVIRLRSDQKVLGFVRGPDGKTLVHGEVITKHDAVVNGSTQDLMDCIPEAFDTHPSCPLVFVCLGGTGTGKSFTLFGPSKTTPLPESPTRGLVHHHIQHQLRLHGSIHVEIREYYMTSAYGKTNGVLFSQNIKESTLQSQWKEMFLALKKRRQAATTGNQSSSRTVVEVALGPVDKAVMYFFDVPGKEIARQNDSADINRANADFATIIQQRRQITEKKTVDPTGKLGMDRLQKMPRRYSGYCRILDLLKGNVRAVAIACINPRGDDREEVNRSLSTIALAEHFASNKVVAPPPTCGPSSTHSPNATIDELLGVIAGLRSRLYHCRCPAANVPSPGSPAPSNSLEVFRGATAPGDYSNILTVSPPSLINTFDDPMDTAKPLPLSPTPSCRQSLDLELGGPPPPAHGDIRSRQLLVLEAAVALILPFLFDRLGIDCMYIPNAWKDFADDEERLVQEVRDHGHPLGLYMDESVIQDCLSLRRILTSLGDDISVGDPDLARQCGDSAYQ